MNFNFDLKKLAFFVAALLFLALLYVAIPGTRDCIAPCLVTCGATCSGRSIIAPAPPAPAPPPVPVAGPVVDPIR